MLDPSCKEIIHEINKDTYIIMQLLAYLDTQEHCAEYTSPLSAFNETKTSNGKSHENE